jgi:putative ABC transport system permease protein
MSVSELLRVALQGLLVNRLRTALTMLGIVIGVAAVILLVAVGNGSAQAVQENIENLGTNTLTVIPGRSGFGASSGTQSQRSQLTAADVKALENKQAAPDVKAVSPIVSAQATGSYQGATYSPARFVGTNSVYQEVGNWKIASGRFFDEDDERSRSRVVVLGQTVVTNLFGVQNPIGADVKFGSATFEVIGVLAPKGSNGVQDQDDIVIAPLTAVQDTLTGNTGTYSTLSVQATARDTIDAAQSEVTSVLEGTHRVTQPDFRIINQGQLLETSSETNDVFTVLLGAVAAISLLVGGIGVMNIMLVTVTERTREIGIRKAIGARKVDILAQFLLEAVLISIAGGLIGVVVGIVGSRFRIIGVDPIVDPTSVVLAFGVAIAVGLFFGGYPANRAASLQPIEALRYE